MNSGSWSAVVPWPIVAIHAIVTPDAKVLTFGTDQTGLQGSNMLYDIWDPVTGTHTTLTYEMHTDIFCSGAVIDPFTDDIIIVGGDARPDGNINGGVPFVHNFDYQTGELTTNPAGNLNFSRWYGTAITLADGKILEIGGTDGAHKGVGTPELYTNGVGWKALPGANTPSIASDWWYPRAWLASTGNVVGYTDFAPGNSKNAVFSINPGGNGLTTDLGKTPFESLNYNPAIMFDKDKVLTIDETGAAWIVDIGGTAPTFTQTAGVGQNRAWSNLLVLADGSVMLSGGSVGDSKIETQTNNVVIWNPDTGEWTSDASASVGRFYHSTTTLLADGTVLSGGGGAPGPLINLNAEIYTPGYLLEADGSLRQDRPVIIDAPDTLNQGQTFTITLDNADAIQKLEFVKFGNSTHSFNSEQRALSLEFTHVDEHTLSVTLPANANVVTPGHWMLFADNQRGTPSIAATIKVQPGGNIYSDELGTWLTVGGSAFHEDDNVFTLTPDAKGQIGSVMSNSRIDLEDNFDLSFDFQMGNKANGADGLSFVLHNDPFGQNASGGGGGGFGSKGILNGLAINFDTWYNPEAGDIAADHAEITRTDDRAAVRRVGNQVALGNLEDGNWHNVQVHWDAGDHKLSYTFDGRTISTLNEDVINKYFGGSDHVYFGFTGATGGASNVHKVRLNSFTATPEDHGPGGGGNAPLNDGCVFDVSTIGASVAVNGDASFDDFSKIFTLTNDEAGKTGGVTFNSKIDLTHSFNINFELFLGAKAQGADGLAFVLHNDPGGVAALAAGGGYLGAYGLQNGLAIEFDTYQNAGPFRDAKGDRTSIASTALGVAAADLSPQVSLGDFTDGKWHQVGVHWDVDTQTLAYWVDGNRTGSLSGDIVSKYLGGGSEAFLGFTGATGGATGIQQLRVTAVDAFFTGYDDIHNCIKDPFATADAAVVNGDASYDASTHIFTLTPNEKGQAGSAFLGERIDITDDFSISFQANFGTNAQGADGIAFVLQNDARGSNAVGYGGGNLGAIGINNGLAIAFDTYQNGNFGDIQQDHTNFLDTSVDLANARVGEQFALGNVQDGAWHAVTVTWNPETLTLQYWIDGRQSLSLNENIQQAYLGGSQYAYLGFTAGTGGTNNLQQVHIDAVSVLYEGQSHGENGHHGHLASNDLHA